MHLFIRDVYFLFCFVNTTMAISISFGISMPNQHPGGSILFLQLLHSIKSFHNRFFIVQINLQRVRQGASN